MYRKQKLTITMAALLLAVVMLFASCASSAAGNQLVVPSDALSNGSGEVASDKIPDTQKPVVTEEPTQTPDTEAPDTAVDPTAVPTAKPTTTPSVTPNPTVPVTDLPLYQFTQFYPETKTIAFSFDDGPSLYTQKILDKIEGTDSKVTFFVVGERLKYPTSEWSLATKRAISLNCEIGFHSLDHKDNYTDLTDEELQSEIDETNTYLAALGGSPVTLLRPVGGTSDRYKDYGYPLILWIKDNRDWEVYSRYNKKEITYDQAVSELTQTIIDQATNGAIVLMHDIYTTSVDAFCNAYDILTEQGYKFVTVSEMLGIQGKNCAGYSFYSTYAAYYLGQRCSN